jgi:hypothetical protein
MEKIKKLKELSNVEPIGLDSSIHELFGRPYGGTKETIDRYIGVTTMKIVKKFYLN